MILGNYATCSPVLCTIHLLSDYTCRWGHDASNVGSSSSGSKSGLSEGGRVRKILDATWW